VDITYTLAGEAAIITLAIETNGVALPGEAVTRLLGDVSTVVGPGPGRHIVWNAGADWPEHTVTNARARVTAWSADAPPPYCAVDVAGGTATNVWPVYYYPSAEGVPGGVTNNVYKTVRILMRKVPATGAEGFQMGSPSTEAGRAGTVEYRHQVVLTKDYYIGVYPVTQDQWQQAMGDTRSWPSRWNSLDYRLTRPVEQVSYFDIRENPAGSSSAISPNWPQSDAVGPDSFMGRMWAKTGQAGFDLPTDAQWEHACRAGTTGALNDGTVNLANSTADARLDLLGRYQSNGGQILMGSTWVNPDTADALGSVVAVTTSNATAAVGSYAPNAWGLYDMHGNVFEWCLDWFAASLGTGAVENPVGAATGSARVSRGGSWASAASPCRSAYRGGYDPSTRGSPIGFRLVRTLP
jgi:formylglycine-generating enzyme required for sulfatase activity